MNINRVLFWVILIALAWFFFKYLLPILLILFVIAFLYSAFTQKKTTSSFKESNTRRPLKDGAIDVEFTQHEDTEHDS